MSVGEYLSVFAAIIIGLAVTDMAASFHRLMRARERVQWDWISLVLALMLLLEILAHWWASFRWYRGTTEIAIAGFLPDLAMFLLLFLAAAAVLPDEVPQEGLSLRRFYLSTARYFWTLLALDTVLVSAIALSRTSMSATQLLAFSLLAAAYLAGVVILIVTRRPWVHMAIVPFLVLLTAWTYLPHGLG